jgi:hypothetical protein
MSIKFKLGEDSGESPVLATFPGGAPDAKTLKKGGDDALHFQLLKNTNSKKAKQRVLQCESGDFEFTGKNFGSDSASSASESRYMMALFDPTKVKGSDGSSQSTKVKLMVLKGALKEGGYIGKTPKKGGEGGGGEGAGEESFFWELSSDDGSEAA